MRAVRAVLWCSIWLIYPPNKKLTRPFSAPLTTLYFKCACAGVCALCICVQWVISWAHSGEPCFCHTEFAPFKTISIPCAWVCLCSLLNEGALRTFCYVQQEGDIINAGVFKSLSFSSFVCFFSRLSFSQTQRMKTCVQKVSIYTLKFWLIAQSSISRV